MNVPFCGFYRTGLIPCADSLELKHEKYHKRQYAYCESVSMIAFVQLWERNSLVEFVYYNQPVYIIICKLEKYL